MGGHTVSLTLLTADWRHWLLQQVERGAAPAVLLRHLSAEGNLRTHTALRAIDEALTQPRRTGHRDTPTGCGPWPRLQTARRQLDAQGQQVTVRMALDGPGVALVDHLLDGADCAMLRNWGEYEAGRRMAVAAHNLQTVLRHPIIDRLAGRLSALVNWPLARFQPLQVCHLRPGDACRLDDGSPRRGTPDAGCGNPVVGSFMVFLDTSTDGGAIGLPGALGLRALPQAGTAIWFDHQGPSGADVAVPQATAAPAGTHPAWVVTTWLHAQDWQLADTA